MDFDLSTGQQRAVAAVVVVVAAVVLGGVAAVALGVGPLGGGGAGGTSDGGATATPPPTGTVYTDMTGGEGEQSPPFSFAIDSIEQCGQTCRDVTVTLNNNRNDTAENVTVYTRIYAGNTTESGDRVWRGQEDIGVLKGGSDATRTQRVELSAGEGLQVQQNDGWITIVTTIRSAETTITFKNRRDVA
jgi:hypothetical protein